MFGRADDQHSRLSISRPHFARIAGIWLDPPVVSHSRLAWREALDEVRRRVEGTMRVRRGLLGVVLVLASLTATMEAAFGPQPGRDNSSSCSATAISVGPDYTWKVKWWPTAPSILHGYSSFGYFTLDYGDFDVWALDLKFASNLSKVSYLQPAPGNSMAGLGFNETESKKIAHIRNYLSARDRGKLGLNAVGITDQMAVWAILDDPIIADLLTVKNKKDLASWKAALSARVKAMQSASTPAPPAVDFLGVSLTGRSDGRIGYQAYLQDLDGGLAKASSIQVGSILGVTDSSVGVDGKFSGSLVDPLPHFPQSVSFVWRGNMPAGTLLQGRTSDGAPVKDALLVTVVDAPTQVSATRIRAGGRC